MCLDSILSYIIFKNIQWEFQEGCAFKCHTLLLPGPYEKYCLGAVQEALGEGDDNNNNNKNNNNFRLAYMYQPEMTTLNLEAV